ncbi:NADP-dependent oxidoreductase [Kutzneria buriramensis]|uniref:NADPH:quinone reductase-like Zn-dependent oxidoreductase n=1 Tax=Kutzneria buriramensis TaxID=1045776 RepID=A0A3E0HIP9_9PSEU|nr:NADP-dependent oxidoreductase [Kutzneria buriramensis]REH46323.1 NADPH:quinone reductase-like Zn-dependent oxidoreductase [Kutzneria buriramensis]
MTDTMQTISQDRLGGPEVLTPATAPVPTPGVSQILVRVHAAGVNPIDATNRKTGMFLGEPPFTLGWDVSGTVAGVGLGVSVHQVGDEVFGMLPFPSGHGAYAEYVVVPARLFVPKPDALTHIEAASLPLAGLTAWQALAETAHVTAGSRVLVNGAAGGVGHLAVQIAKALGAHVTAVVSAPNVDFARALGADDVIDRATTDYTKTVRNLDVVLDTTGGDPLPAFDSLKVGGVFVTLAPPVLGPARAEAERRRIRSATLLVEADRVGMNALVDLVAGKQLTPVVGATFPLAEAGAAQSTQPARGKTVLVVS